MQRLLTGSSGTRSILSIGSEERAVDAQWMWTAETVGRQRRNTWNDRDAA